MRKILITALCLGTLILTGCQYGEAKDALKSLLNDPDSAKFSRLSDGKDKGDVCGYFNAKNRMGGYVGETAFIYNKLTEQAMIVTPPTDSDYHSLALSVGSTSGLFREKLSEISMKCYAVDRWIEQCKEPPPRPKHDMCDKGTDEFFNELKRRFE